MIRWGLIARADDRGLGILTWEVARHLHPDRVLIVREPGAEARGFLPHLDRFPDGGDPVTYRDGALPEGPVREWLDGLEAVYSAETFYDDRLATWADEAGAVPVVHVMPELFRPGLPPSVRWIPTPWRADLLEPARLVPIPVATERFPAPPALGDPLRVLHVAGHPAKGDRNGTTLFLQAVRLLRQPAHVRVTVQGDRVPHPGRIPRHVEFEVISGGVEHYWDLYADADVLVLPRRYGGLSLPVQEAMAAGLAVVLPDCEPNRWWPAVHVPSGPRGSIETAAGTIRLQRADPRDLARAIDRLAADSSALEDARAGSLGWAARHSWDALAPVWERELTAAARGLVPSS